MDPIRKTLSSSSAANVALLADFIPEEADASENNDAVDEEADTAAALDAEKIAGFMIFGWDRSMVKRYYGLRRGCLGSKGKWRASMGFSNKRITPSNAVGGIFQISGTVGISTAAHFLGAVWWQDRCFPNDCFRTLVLVTKKGEGVPSW